ncbi:conserved hypothetical protein [Aspergillus terreus NIH2624]|uniref:Sialidase domain-containing protein n=1 Tax=Aspergillus terreus (strain NIH 2624 / FGSC A1156) TaxID=341663 RepID=Q0CEH5_ASPTN|nr:uncharacterized protein ATEG_07909 [Aspergillus terreus NIH2624]EAU32171.1 conserved hypothetical protein [Aspergillus terreus NIH2624]
MPNFGQKILKHLGLEEGHASGFPGHGQGQGHGQPDAARLPGNRVINNDERSLSNRPGGTYPRICRMGDGSVLSSFTRFNHGERILTVARSVDGARTFEDIGEVTRGRGDVDNLFLLEVAPNVVLGAFRNHDLGPGGPTHFRITVCRSVDGGRSWQFASQAAESKPPCGIWEPFMRLGQRGEVQLTYSQEYAHNNQCTMLVRSWDQGATWSPPECLHGREHCVRDGMNGIAQTWDNGRPALVMVFETTTHGTFDLEALISYDDGATWGHRHEVYVPPRGHNAGAPQIAAFGDGSLAVIFMTDEDHHQVEWTKNACIKVVFAGPPQDGRIFWTRPTVLCPGQGHWPGIAALDQRTLLATYDCGGPKAKSITLH